MPESWRTVRRCVLYPTKRVLKDGVQSWDYPKKHSHAGRDIGCRPGFILLCSGETYKESRPANPQPSS